MKYKYIRRSALLRKLDEIEAEENRRYKERMSALKDVCEESLSRGYTRVPEFHCNRLNTIFTIRYFIKDAPTEEGERGKWLNKNNLISVLDAKYSELAGMSGSFYSGFQYALSLVKLCAAETDVLIKINQAEKMRKEKK